MHPDLPRAAARLNVQGLQQVGEVDVIDQAIDDQPHGAVVGMGTQVDDGAVEARVAHARHGDQQLSLERAFLRRWQALQRHPVLLATRPPGLWILSAPARLLSAAGHHIWRRDRGFSMTVR